MTTEIKNIVRLPSRTIGTISIKALCLLLALAVVSVAICPGVLFDHTGKFFDAFLPNFAATVVGLVLTVVVYDVSSHAVRQREREREAGQAFAVAWHGGVMRVHDCFAVAKIPAPELFAGFVQAITQNPPTLPNLGPEKYSRIGEALRTRLASLPEPSIEQITADLITTATILGGAQGTHVPMGMLAAARFFSEAGNAARTTPPDDLRAGRALVGAYWNYLNGHLQLKLNETEATASVHLAKSALRRAQAQARKVR